MANPALDRRFGGPAGPLPAAVSAGPMVADTMTVGGTVRATTILLALLVAGGVWGWTSVGAASGLLLVAVLVALGAAIATIVKPEWSRATAPIYAVAEGVALGAISRVYEAAFDGLVVQAILGTVVVLGVMLVLYATRTIVVTDRMRSTILVATLGIAAFYVVSLLLSFFGVGIPFVWDAGPLGIAFSAFVIVVAAFNLLLDFDLIERGARRGFPAVYEWFAAFGLLLTLVWLYLEILRLLAKLQER